MMREPGRALARTITQLRETDVTQRELDLRATVFDPAAVDFANVLGGALERATARGGTFGAGFFVTRGAGFSTAPAGRLSAERVGARVGRRSTERVASGGGDETMLRRDSRGRSTGIGSGTG